MKRSDSEIVYRWAVDLALSGRLFTLEQVARHPVLAERSQPKKRASEALRPFTDSFERFPQEIGKPHIWRLSTKYKRANGVKQHAIDARSQNVDHWLAITDLWIEITQNVGRPVVWIDEPTQSDRFDVFAQIGRKTYLFEIQRTDLSPNEWQKKLQSRVAWLQSPDIAKAPWQTYERTIVPKPVIITPSLTNVPLVTAFMYCTSNTDFVRKLQRELIAMEAK